MPKADKIETFKYKVPLKIKLLSFFGIAKIYIEQNHLASTQKNQRLWAEVISIKWKEKEYIVSQKIYTYKLS